MPFKHITIDTESLIYLPYKLLYYYYFYYLSTYNIHTVKKKRMPKNFSQKGCFH